jgi:hypothetical protein
MDVAVSNQLVDQTSDDGAAAAVLLEQKWESIKPAPFGAPQVLALAWLGTAFAGGLYPVVLILWGNLLEPLANGTEINWGELAVSIIAFAFGFFYAGIVACPCFFLRVGMCFNGAYQRSADMAWVSRRRLDGIYLHLTARGRVRSGLSR